MRPAQTPGGQAREEVGLFLIASLLLEPGGDGTLGQWGKSDLAAARSDRREEGRGLGGDEDQQRCPWRLFQGLEEGVLGLLGHRLGLIQDEHLAPSLVGPQGCLLGEGADLIDLQGRAFRSQQVDVGVDSFGDLVAGGASVTAIPLDPRQAVQRLGNRDSCQRPPHSFGSSEKERMGETTGFDHPSYKRDRLSLAKDFRKAHWFSFRKAGSEQLLPYRPWAHSGNRLSKRCTISLWTVSGLQSCPSPFTASMLSQ